MSGPELPLTEGLMARMSDASVLRLAEAAAAAVRSYWPTMAELAELAAVEAAAGITLRERAAMTLRVMVGRNHERRMELMTRLIMRGGRMQ